MQQVIVSLWWHRFISGVSGRLFRNHSLDFAGHFYTMS